MDQVQFAIVESKLGYLVLVAGQGRLIRLDIAGANPSLTRGSVLSEFPGARESVTPFKHIVPLLSQYFDGKPVVFDTPVDLSGVPDFTKRVLIETSRIPYGRVASYGQIGKRVGYPSAGRAVGQALNRNQIPIVIPCHRVVNSDGTLGGFGLGLHMKVKLLTLEGIDATKLKHAMLPE